MLRMDRQYREVPQRKDDPKVLAPQEREQMDRTQQGQMREVGTSGSHDSRRQEALSNAERFAIDEDILALLRSDPIAWNNLQTFPKLYVRVRIDNIQYLKDMDPDTYRRRLDRFMEHTKRNEMYGDWNDDGKLLMGTTE